jgi:hypothetical protein
MICDYKWRGTWRSIAPCGNLILMLSGISVYTNMNDLYDCDVYKGADVFLIVFGKLLLDDSIFTARCVRMYYTAVFTMWISLMMTVYLVSATDFSGRGRSFLCVNSCDRLN